MQGTDASTVETPWATVDIERDQPLDPEWQQWSQHVRQPEPVQDAHDWHGAVQHAYIKM